MMRPCAVRRARLPPLGFTVVEVIVVVAIFGFIAGMSGLAFVTLRAPRQSELVHELRRARAEAIQTGRPVVSGNHRAPRTAHVLFLPDGRALGPGVDPFTGVPLDASH
jgi:prepilin-type N-terminal cleavage/methylation domain-containing protein